MDDILRQANHYRIQVRRTSRGHYKAVDRAQNGHMWLGVPVVVASAVVGASLFATLQNRPGEGWQIAAGLVSPAAAVFAALQTFFRFAERVEKHRVAAASYGAVRRSLDLFILKHGPEAPRDRDAAIADLAAIVERFSQLALESPDIPPKAFKAAVREIEDSDERKLTGEGIPVA